MKLIIIFMTAFLMHASASSFAQRITLKSNNITLRKAFSEVRKQTGFIVLIESELLNKSKPVKLDLSNVPLENALEKMLDGQNLEFSIKDKSIIVKEKEKPSVIQKIVDYFVNIDVTGRVVDEKGEPIAGATVKVKGTNILAVTDGEGKFVLKNIADDALIEIFSIGFKTKELRVSKELGDLRLEVAVGNLDMVNVVSTGYETLTKDRATGAFYRLDSTVLNRTVSSNIISRIEKVTSGLQLYQSQLSIRGRSTIFANQNPLIVVDNFPYDGPIGNINPNDIENITVLKDAAAASIWGALSGNGVVVITTKKGRYNQPLKVQFNSDVTLMEKPNLHKNPNFINSSDFISTEQFLFSKGFYDGAINDNINFQGYSPVVDILARQRAGQLSLQDANQMIQAYKNMDVRNQLLDYFYRTGLNQQHALNISGGSTKLSHYLSVGVDENQSSLVEKGTHRFTFSSQSTFKPFSRLEITGNLNLMQTKSFDGNNLKDLNNKIAGSHFRLYPYAQFSDGVKNFPITRALSDFYTNSSESKGLLNWQYYPIEEIGRNTATTKGIDLRLNGGIKYTILKGLTIDGKYQYLRVNANDETIYGGNSYYTRDFVNRYTILNSNGTIKRNFPAGDIVVHGVSNTTANSGRIQLGYDLNNGPHQLAAIAGADIREVITTGNSNGLAGYNSATGTSVIYNPDTLYQTLPSGSSRIGNFDMITGRLNRYRSYFANSTYTYLSKYSFSASARIDQANLFGYKANQRSTPLWSAGIKWDISKESFYRFAKLQNLSFRMTYGLNGNLSQTATPLTLMQYYGTLLPSGISSFAAIQTPGNPELTWEKIRMLNLGLDFSTENNRVSGSLDFYKKSGKNMIGDDLIDPTVGFSTVTGNFSDIQGLGLDLVLNTRNFYNFFKWNTSFLMSFAKNKVTKYRGNSVRTSILEGRPVNSVYALPWGGLDPENGDPIGVLNGNLSKDYNALNALPIENRIFIGSRVPLIFGNILNEFALGKFSLSANMSYKLGYYFPRNSIDYSSFFTSWSGQHVDFSSRWKQKGDETKTTVPSLIYPANQLRDAYYNQSEVLITRGDHIRLEDIRASYSFKLDRGNFRANGQFFIYVNNIGVIWSANKQEIDPNYSEGYLPPKTISLGLRLSL